MTVPGYLPWKEAAFLKHPFLGLLHPLSVALQNWHPELRFSSFPLSATTGRQMESALFPQLHSVEMAGGFPGFEDQ